MTLISFVLPLLLISFVLPMLLISIVPIRSSSGRTGASLVLDVILPRDVGEPVTRGNASTSLQQPRTPPARHRSPRGAGCTPAHDGPEHTRRRKRSHPVVNRPRIVKRSGKGELHSTRKGRCHGAPHRQSAAATERRRGAPDAPPRAATPVPAAPRRAPRTRPNATLPARTQPSWRAQAPQSPPPRRGGGGEPPIRRPPPLPPSPPPPAAPRKRAQTQRFRHVRPPSGPRRGDVARWQKRKQGGRREAAQREDGGGEKPAKRTGRQGYVERGRDHGGGCLGPGPELLVWLLSVSAAV